MENNAQDFEALMSEQPPKTLLADTIHDMYLAYIRIHGEEPTEIRVHPKLYGQLYTEMTTGDSFYSTFVLEYSEFSGIPVLFMANAKIVPDKNVTLVNFI